MGASRVEKDPSAILGKRVRYLSVIDEWDEGVPGVRQSFKNILMFSVATLALAGCTLGPDFFRPTPPPSRGHPATPLPPESASADTIAGDAQRFLQDADVPGQWWSLFRSPVLDGLVDQALRANPDIDAAQATLRQAHENYLAQEGSFFPQVNGSGSFGRQQLTTTGKSFDLFNASVSVSYLVDVFGQVRRSVEASGALEENSRFQLEATYLTLTSNVSTAPIQ